MAARDLDVRPSPAAPRAAVHPLTRQDAAIHAKRYYAKITETRPRIDSFYTYLHTEIDPAYTEAAAAWPGYLEAFPDDDILDMFKTPVSPELERWLLEYVRIHWPDADLSAVMGIAADRSVHPLHIAAAMGLAGLCERILDDNKKLTDPDAEEAGEAGTCSQDTHGTSHADIDQLSTLGTPLYCALVGPRVFLQEHCLLPADMGRPECLSLQQEDTIRLLRDRGATGLNMTRPRFNTTLSVQSIAFWVCGRLRSAGLFSKLYPPKADDFSFELDYEFASMLGSLDHLNDPLMDLGTRRMWCDMLLTVSDGFMAVYDIEDYDDLIDQAWDALGRAWDGHFDTSLYSTELPLKNLTDSEYSHLIRRAVQQSQLTVVQRMSCDARFDPNMTMADPGGPSADADEVGATLLHSAVREDHVSIVEFLLSMGAKPTTRDAQGRTPLLVCESVFILLRLLAHGGSTTDVDSAGRNIWHYAAASNDGDMLNWLVLNDPCMPQNITRRMHQDGRTPAAQAIIYPLINFPEGRPTKPDFERVNMTMRLWSAMILLKAGRGIPGSLHCDGPALFEAAMRWADEDLIEGMRDCGFHFDYQDDRGNALHRLTFSCTTRLLDLLWNDCVGLPMINKDGNTPLETIFFNTYMPVLDDEGGASVVVTTNPVRKDFDGRLEVEVVDFLVIMVCPGCEGKVRQDVSATGFERFVRLVIGEWLAPHAGAGYQDSLPLHNAVTHTMRCLRDQHWVRDFREIRGRSAGAFIWEFSRGLQLQGKSFWWDDLILTCFAMTIDQQNLIGDPRLLPKGDLAVFEDALVWIMANFQFSCRAIEVRDALNNVLPIPARIEGVPAMLYACRSRCCSGVFEAVMRRALPLRNKRNIAAARQAIKKNNLPFWEARMELLDLLIAGAENVDEESEYEDQHTDVDEPARKG